MIKKTFTTLLLITIALISHANAQIPSFKVTEANFKILEETCVDTDIKTPDIQTAQACNVNFFYEDLVYPSFSPLLVVVPKNNKYRLYYDRLKNRYSDFESIVIRLKNGGWVEKIKIQNNKMSDENSLYIYREADRDSELEIGNNIKMKIPRGQMRFHGYWASPNF